MDDLPLPIWVIVLIPLALGLAPFLYAAFGRWLRHKEKHLEAETRLAAEKAAQYAASNAKLEQRVRVLEQIVTDAGAHTASQIEALRERPALESGERSA
jgi:hypothetical protein